LQRVAAARNSAALNSVRVIATAISAPPPPSRQRIGPGRVPQNHIRVNSTGGCYKTSASYKPLIALVVARPGSLVYDVAGSRLQ
jgi:hypothetical protein